MKQFSKSRVSHIKYYKLNQSIVRAWFSALKYERLKIKTTAVITSFNQDETRETGLFYQLWSLSDIAHLLILFSGFIYLYYYLILSISKRKITAAIRGQTIKILEDFCWHLTLGSNHC